MIGGKAPSTYLKQIQTNPQVGASDAEMDGILRTHLIDPSLLRTDRFEAFYGARKGALLSLVGAAMGKQPVDTGEDVTEDPDDLEEDAAAS